MSKCTERKKYFVKFKFSGINTIRVVCIHCPLGPKAFVLLLYNSTIFESLKLCSEANKSVNGFENFL